jgi:iron complex outermembrane receptor protein
MKQLFTTTGLLLFVFIGLAQYKIEGRVLQKGNHLPVAGANVSLAASGSPVTVTDNKGQFVIGNLKRKGSYQLTIEFVGLKSAVLTGEASENPSPLAIEMEQQWYFLEPLEVKSVRASDKAPFSKTNLSKQDLAKLNLGQDLPFLLQQTPSVVSNSDAGNAVGYTGIRIRGTDPTRINVTLNGIPYNDAESQGTFFVDLPDIASSISSIQIQRGVGTSSNGAGAFGATIALSTNEFNEKAYGEINNAAGSFNTWKHTLKAGTGLIGEHFTVDARASKVSSDGFIDRAATDLKSLQLSAAYYNKKSSLRFNLITGAEKTYQAWYGVPGSLLNTNRTFNSAGTAKPGEPYDNETDNYQQDHYQLFFNHSFSNKLFLNIGTFLTKGKGYYEQYKAGAKFSSYGLPNRVFGATTVTRTDLIRQLWLDNNFYGQIFSIQYKGLKDGLTFGGAWNKYDGKHFGEVLWANMGVPVNYRWYNVKSEKTDQNFYGKWQHSLNSNWQTFVDVQYRHAGYTTEGFRNNPRLGIDRTFNFINPKAGVTYSNRGWQVFGSYAMGNKEPNREDFEAGVTTQPLPERLHDFELGIEKRNNTASWGATAYYMLYKNQLILTGQVNDVGAYTRINIPNSYRLGLELQGSAKVAEWINMSGNLTFSRNKIKRSEEYVDEYNAAGTYLGQVKTTFANTDISYSPSLVGAGAINLLPFNNLEFSLLGKYVGRQYLDNTENKFRSLNPYYVQDIRVNYSPKNKPFSLLNIIGQVNNVFNKKYEPNGYTYSYISDKVLSTENYYFPMAGINFMLGINVSF